MFASRDEKINEWNKLIERYIALHKYIKDVGKIGITQGRSGHINKEVQIKLVEALMQTDKTLQQLKNIFKPCLTEVDTQGIFAEEDFKTEIETLNKKVADLTRENESLKQPTGRKDGNYKNLQLETECLMLLEDKKILEERIRQLETHCRILSDQVSELVSMNVNNEHKDKSEKPDIIYLQKQEQLEETLKTQNDLIYDLKKQLEDTTKEKEIFKSLNKDLDAEIQKKNGTKFDVQSKNKEEIDIRSHLTYGCSNRSTLRIDEFANTENKQLDFEDVRVNEIAKLREDLESLVVTSMEELESATENK